MENLSNICKMYAATLYSVLKTVLLLFSNKKELLHLLTYYLKFLNSIFELKQKTNLYQNNYIYIV